ncbi:right-handed parallel beta-helix repeat-containing protein, partial [Candidatus Bipolaricaulota bacterium]|nr:right-handed parallel beta-helix repeat-containing protein [Candidatus Bipolaricaulota bacterium]
MRKVLILAVLAAMSFSVSVFCDADDDAMSAGGLRLEALQNNDGGWDWPLDDGNPNSASPLNTIGPIATGLARAYWNGGETAYQAALLDAGGLLLSKTNNFSPSDGYLATMLDSVFGGAVYRDHVLANFYGPLNAGTYDRNGAGTLYDTASYITSIYASRSSWGGGNLAAWDVGMGLVGAVAAGANATEWIAGTKTEIDRLVEPAWYDVIGLAGALYGLAFAEEEFDPTTGAHAAAGNLADLADTLASYQIPGGTGGFSWESDYLSPGNSDETVQETAYAILALNEVDREAYLGVTEDAANWLVAFQLGTGGWKNWDGGTENNEISGEAMWGIHTVYVEDIWVDENGDDHAFGYGYIPFETLSEAVSKIGGTNGTIHIGDGTFTLGPGTYITRLFIEGDATVSGVGTTTLMSPGSTSVTIAESSRTWDPIVFAYGGTMDASNHVSGAATIQAQVSGFEIDGQNSAVSGKRFVGILLRNVDGEVSDNSLHDLYDADGKGDGPETFGILVYGDSAIDILNNTITDYSRGGIGINGDLGSAPDPVVTVQGNTLTGNGFEGETGWWADNGIQFGYGATGQIVGNTVTGHWSNSAWGASGIIIASTSNVDIIQNLVADNELGIALAGYSVYGAPYEASDNILVRQNEIIANEYGISLQMDANNTLILMNNITGNTVGISVADYYGVEAVGTEIHYNSIVGNVLGVENWEVDSDIDASLNWWGALSGPTADLDGDGSPDYVGGGDGIFGNVIFSPWLGSAPDGDLGQWGVQITEPMLIVVDDIGPAPGVGYLNAAIGASNSANLPFTDTIEVR